ncbi:glycosyltransferase family 2 protein [Patescibacteria group bacterium]|nr:glycosyltransferase family 2 protein [Patescibacteria group bacterium]
MKQLPKVGIIYLTFPVAKWERDINGCLSSLERLNYPKDRVELICVESKWKIGPLKDWFDKTWLPKSGKELPRITYILKDEMLGFAENNNIGLEKAKELGCEYVHLTNEDTYVDPDYLLKAVERAEQDPTIACVQSLILLGSEPDKVNTIGNAFHYLGFGYSNGYRWSKNQALAHLANERKTNPNLEIGYAAGAAVLVRIAALEGRPLFENKFYLYHEDTDLTLFLRLRGFKTVIEPASIVWHHYEFGKNKFNYYYMERNRYVLLWMYYRWPTLLLLMPMICLMDLGILLFSIKNGWFDMKWRAYRDWFSKDFRAWVWGRRRLIQRVRKLSDKEFLRPAISEIAFQEESVKNPLLEHIGNPILKVYWGLVYRLIRW